MSSSSPTRRHFLVNSSLGLAAAMSGAGTVLAADDGKKDAKADAKPAAKKEPRKASPNELINVAVIGTGGRGGSHIGDLLGLGDYVNLVAICDADASHMIGHAKHIEEETGTAPKMYQDMRKLLEDKDIDAVTIATPNHWHTLASIWAIQAGKDVYVEKPASHNIWEGRRLVEIAREHKKVVLHGTQSRSTVAMNQAMKFLHDGGLGRVFLARGLCYKGRGPIGDVSGEQAVPKEVDYDLWLGPAPMKPLGRQKLHYDWHWFWDYGNGDIGNQGVHQMDIAMWGLGKRELAKRVQCVGGRFGYVDDAETPNTQVAVLDYDDAQIVFEVRGLKTKPIRGAKEGVANVFYGTEGTLVVNDYNNCVAFAPNGEKIEMPKYEGDAGGNHMVTFVKAMQSRTLDFDRGEIEAGHVSSGLCHMANISYRMGTKTPFNSKTKAFGDDKAAYASLERMEEHLAENGLKLEETEYVLGRALEFDPKAERFTNDEEANKLLTREYRAPYVVPAKA